MADIEDSIELIKKHYTDGKYHNNFTYKYPNDSISHSPSEYMSGDSSLGHSHSDDGPEHSLGSSYDSYYDQEE